MRILWDEPKRQTNLAKHEMNFGALTVEFFEGAIIRSGHNERSMALGWLEDELIVAVVFQPLGSEAVSVISMRPASKSERRLHDQYKNQVL